ncbi:621_t:CDS:1, partial [Dentiscutata erythropus]
YITGKINKINQTNNQLQESIKKLENKNKESEQKNNQLNQTIINLKEKNKELEKTTISINNELQEKIDNLNLLKQKFDSFKKSIKEQKKIDTLVTEICTMLSINSDNNLLKIYHVLIPNNSADNLTDQKEIIKSICNVLDIKYIENNENQNL